MNNIVELLREASKQALAIAPKEIPNTLYWKAADEIERIRSKLQQMKRQRDEAYEEAAKVCEGIFEPHWYGYENPYSFNNGTEACAEAIRALKDKP